TSVPALPPTPSAGQERTQQGGKSAESRSTPEQKAAPATPPTTAIRTPRPPGAAAPRPSRPSSPPIEETALRSVMDVPLLLKIGRKIDSSAIDAITLGADADGPIASYKQRLLGYDFWA